jgi:flagellin-like hook-associated protein FlgL
MAMSISTNTDLVQAPIKNVQTGTLAKVAAEARAPKAAEGVQATPPPVRPRTSADLMRGVRNAADEVGRLQVVDQAINNVAKSLDRMHTLATQSANENYAGDRTVANLEFKKLLTGIDHQAQAVGLDSGGRFAAAVGVAMGNAVTHQPTDARANANAVTVDLSADVMDTRGLGLKPDNVLATRANGTSMAAASATGLGEKAEPFRFIGLSASGAVAERQVLSLSAPDATGKVQSLSVTLDMSNATQAGQAANTINQALLPHPVLKDVVAVPQQDARGRDGIRFLGAMENFTVEAGTATSVSSFGPVGLHNATKDAVAAQGVAVASARLGTPDISTATNAQRALGLLGGAAERLARSQSSVEKAQNQLGYALALARSDLDKASTGPQIRDSAVALESAQRTRLQLLLPDGAARNTQANSSAESVLALLRS